MYGECQRGKILIPWRAKEAEEVLVGQPCSEETMGRAGVAAVAGAKPLRDNSFKVSLVKGALKDLLEKANGAI